MGDDSDDQIHGEAWRRMIDSRLDDIRAHVREIRTQVRQGREDEIVDRLQDVERGIDDLRSEVESASFVGLAKSAGSDPRLAITLVVLFTIAVSGLLLLLYYGVDISAMFSQSLPVLLAPLSALRLLRERIQQKEHPNPCKHDEEEEEWRRIVCLEQWSALTIGGLGLLVWIAVVALSGTVRKHIAH